MKFVLFVEGHTERAAVPEFLKRSLDPHLKQPVGIQAVKFEGGAHFLSEVEKKARLYLGSPQKADIVGVIGLLDLYGTPRLSPSGEAKPAERARAAAAMIEKQVDHPNFRMFFAVHELEAWILGDHRVLPTDVRSALKGNATKNPEHVNFDEPPSKLLQRLYRAKLGREYKKLTYGRDLFSQLDPETVAARCPQFRTMRDALLELAHGAGL